MGVNRTFSAKSPRLDAKHRPVMGANVSASIIREIPDNGRPCGTQLLAATPSAFGPVPSPVPARLLDLSFNAVAEFWRSGLVALLHAAVAVVRRTSGKKHQQAHRGQCGREWVHGGSFRSRECRYDCSSGSTNWPSMTAGHVRSGSKPEVQRGPRNVRSWGQSGSRFRAAGGPFIARSRH